MHAAQVSVVHRVEAQQSQLTYTSNVHEHHAWNLTRRFSRPACLRAVAVPAMQVIFNAISGNSIDVMLKHWYALKLITDVYCLFPDLVSALVWRYPSLFRRGCHWRRTCPQFVATARFRCVTYMYQCCAVCREITPVKNIRVLFCQKDMNVVLKHFANFKRTVETAKDCMDIC